MTAARCTGHCCRSFPLAAGTVFVKRRLEELKPLNPEEFARLSPMLLPLLARGERGAQLFTCRFFDGKNCTTYETRPDMCVRFPGNEPCPYPDCTYRAE